MDLGFVSLNTPRDIDPDVLGPELESRGFESMWVGEHPKIPVSGKDRFPGGLLGAQKRMWDPFLSLLAAAQATTDLRIGTAVVLPLERELFTLAKEVATLDPHLGGVRGDRRGLGALMVACVDDGVDLVVGVAEVHVTGAGRGRPVRDLFKR